MGMVLGITQLDDRTIERLVADPPLVWLVVAGDDRERYERARQDERRLRKPGFIARLFGGRGTATSAGSFAVRVRRRGGEGDRRRQVLARDALPADP
jgi:hypothetical protein